MGKKRKISKEKKAAKLQSNLKRSRPDVKPAKPCASEASIINPGSNGNQGSANQNLVNQGREPVSASHRINRTARDAYQGRALVPQVASTNNNEDDTVQPMEVTPAPVSNPSE